jgi:ANTAR domain
MERHAIDERQAFALLRSHSRRTGRKLTDLAEAIATSHLLLASQPATTATQTRRPPPYPPSTPRTPSPTTDSNTTPPLQRRGLA